MTLVALGMAVFLVSVPFGWWREGSRRFSPTWFVAVHGPIPFVYLLRTRLGIGWGAETFPALVAAYFGGQYIGAVLRRRRRA